MRRLIIAVGLLAICLVATIGIIAVLDSPMRPLGESQKLSSHNYHIEDGLGKVDEVVRGAVESYLSQDPIESHPDRVARLSRYFSGQSPVYNYEPDNLGAGIQKSSSYVLSIRSSESESATLNISVRVRTTKTSHSGSQVVAQTYLVSLHELSDGAYIAYDIKEVLL